MKRTSMIFLCLLLTTVTSFPQVVNAQHDKQEQIKMALLAAPVEARQEAHVYGYDRNGKLVTLRKGSNDFICISDNPDKEGFEVVAYHKSLEPFMARGRALREEGRSFKERGDIREAEAKSGKLKMPESPATLHVYYGKEVRFDEAKKTLEGASYRYVVYIPFATQASTGLPLKPNGSGHPWLMDPGKHNAHIMITPPATSGN